MATNIIIVIFITSLATYLSRFLGVVSAEKIKETSKMFRWFNCLAYSTLAALIARIIIFPSGSLSEVDYSISVPGVSRFRVNVFNQRGNFAAAYRRLPYEIPSIDSLGLPPSVIELTKRRKGLILITGTTGSGKSTTLASIIYKLTQELEGHIITIEDPIEFQFSSTKNSIKL